MGDLTKKVSPWQRSLWDLHKLEQPDARRCERQGEERYEAFKDFTPESFGDLYSGGKLEDLETDSRAPGSEWATKLHEQLQNVPEWGALRDRCAGDDWWSGIGATSLIESVLRGVQGPPNKIEDPRPDAEVEAYLKRLAERQREAGETEAAEELEKEAEGRAVCCKDKVEEAQWEADLMDSTDIRNAIRNAAEEANDEIDRNEAALDAFSVGAGDGVHSGRTMGGLAPRKLAALVRENERLGKIAQYAGRLRRIASERQRGKPRRGTDEITGIVQGDDLSRLLVAEALDAIDPVRECLFAQKLHEQALLQYELNRTPPKESGPIVMCLDSSGSMASEDRSEWAAGVALAFLSIAQEQGRAFELIHFGRTVLRKDSFPAKTRVKTDEVIGAVEWFAGDGGTDFEAPLEEAVSTITGNSVYEDADIIMVTDGHSRVSDRFIDVFTTAKTTLGFKLYSVLVGSAVGSGENRPLDRLSDVTIGLADAVRDEAAMHSIFSEV